MYKKYIKNLFIVVFAIISNIMIQRNAKSEPITANNWILETQNQKVKYAAVVNESGGVFGQFCYVESESCIYLIGLDTSCENGNRYPVLLNSNNGTSVHEIYCDGKLNTGKYRYAFTDFKKIDEIVRESKRIGIALTLIDDQFKIIRFDVYGGGEAIDYMRNIINKEYTSEKNTRDEFL